MKIETLNVEEMDNQLSIIEENHKTSLLSIHENMEKLISDCEQIVVLEDDKESYDKAVELKRIVKKTHVSIENKRKELKQPLIDYGKRLDKFVTTIYEPLVKAEKLVKSKMEAYEIRQEKLKQERKQKELEEQKIKEEIDAKLVTLQSTLGKINLAKSKSELDAIMTYLDDLDLKSFGERSAEAGFISNQLKMTCTMAYKLFADEQIKVDNKPIGSPIPDISELKTESISPKTIVVEETNDVIPTKTIVEKSLAEEVVEQFDVISPPVETPKIEFTELSDDEIIQAIGDVSLSVFDQANSFLMDLVYSNLSEKYKGKYIKKDTLDFIALQSVVRLGVYLTKKN